MGDLGIHRYLQDLLETDATRRAKQEQLVAKGKKVIGL